MHFSLFIMLCISLRVKHRIFRTPQPQTSVVRRHWVSSLHRLRSCEILRRTHKAESLRSVRPDVKRGRHLGPRPCVKASLLARQGVLRRQALLSQQVSAFPERVFDLEGAARNRFWIWVGIRNVYITNVTNQISTNFSERAGKHETIKEAILTTNKEFYFPAYCNI